jgi:hypothetical protein
MMSVLPDLERDLVAAARRRAALPAHGRPWPHRWLARRSRTVQALLAFAVLSAAAASAATLAGTPSAPLSGAVSSDVRYRITLAPYLQPGEAGWCIWDQQATRSGQRLGGVGSCGPTTAALGTPLFARIIGPTIAVITAPTVAAVRIVDGPTILTRTDPSLPFGFRAAVFDAKRELTGSVNVGRSLHSYLALDAQGHPITGGATVDRPLGPLGFPVQPLPTQAWARAGSGPRRPPNAGCATRATVASGLQALSGVDVTEIAPDPAILGHAFLDCSDTIYSNAANQFTATVLLDAKRPGTRPAALPDARSVAGHPGLFAIPADGPGPGLGVRPFFGANTYARRDHNAWLVVTGAKHTLRTLDDLTIARIDLRSPAITTTGLADAPCAIGYQPHTGLLETIQTPWHGAPPPWGPNPRLYPCTRTTFYLHNWPLRAQVFAPIAEPGTPHHPRLHPIPGHPRDFAVAANGYTGPGIWRRHGRTWLTVTGGRNTQQQLTVINDLTVHTTTTPKP